MTTDHLVVSFLPRYPTSFVEKHLPDDVPVVRVMSNVAVLVDEAMSVVAPGARATDEHLVVAEELLGYVGRVIRLKECISTRSRRPRVAAPRTSSCSPRR